MEIKHMKTLVQKGNFLEDFEPNEPMMVTEIEEMEAKYNNGNPFPRAFREYLFIAGKGGQVGAVTDDWEGLQEDYEEFKDVFEFEPSRPIFPFERFDGGSVFFFFYLDEDKPDPDCYILESGDYITKD